MLHLNVAACSLKMGEWRKSLETCNKVTFNEQRLKGLFLNHKLLFSETFVPSIFQTGPRSKAWTCEGSVPPCNGLHGRRRV